MSTLYSVNAAHNIVRCPARSASVSDCERTSTDSLPRSKSIQFTCIEIQFNVASNVPSISSDCIIPAKCCSLTHAQRILQPTKTSCRLKVGTEGEKGYGASSSSSPSSRGRNECRGSDVIGIGGIYFHINPWIQYLQESES